MSEQRSKAPLPPADSTAQRVRDTESRSLAEQLIRAIRIAADAVHGDDPQVRISVMDDGLLRVGVGAYAGTGQGYVTATEDTLHDALRVVLAKLRADLAAKEMEATAKARVLTTARETSDVR